MKMEKKGKKYKERRKKCEEKERGWIEKLITGAGGWNRGRVVGQAKKKKRVDEEAQAADPKEGEVYDAISLAGMRVTLI